MPLTSSSSSHGRDQPPRASSPSPTATRTELVRIPAAPFGVSKTLSASRTHHRRVGRMARPAQAQTVPAIPALYRIALLYVEPAMAFNGALLCLFAPSLFLRTFSPLLAYSSDNQIVYDQLAATYLLFAFNEAVVLRLSKDLSVWKAMLAGILICDIAHFWAGWKVMVQEGNTSPGGWRIEDWVAILSLLIPGSIRVAFLLEIGFAGGREGKLNGKRSL